MGELLPAVQALGPGGLFGCWGRGCGIACARCGTRSSLIGPKGGGHALLHRARAGLGDVAHTGGSATAVLNGANEEAVGQFLAGQLSFSGIAEQVAYAMAAVPAVQFTDWLVPSGHIHTTTSTLEYQSPLALVICA